MGEAMPGVTTVEQEYSARHGGWMVVVQGINIGFATEDGILSAPPAAVWSKLRDGSDANIVEGPGQAKSWILQGRYPRVGGMKVDFFSGKQAVGNLTVPLLGDDVLVALTSYYYPPLGKLVENVAASTAEQAVFTVRGDVTNETWPGRVLFVGKETIRVVSSQLSNGDTEITAYRGQYGTERPKHNKGQHVFITPPYWAGRKVTLLRMFGEADSGAAAQYWTGYLQNITPTGGAAEWELTALDARVKCEAQETLDFCNTEDARCLMIVDDTRNDQEDERRYLYLWVGGGISQKVRSGQVDPYDESFFEDNRYLQVGKSIVYVSETGMAAAVSKLGYPRIFGVKAGDANLFGTKFPDGVQRAAAVYGEFRERDQLGEDFQPSAVLEEMFGEGSELSIFQLVVLKDEHPLEMVLKLLLSQGGGGEYDTLSIGLGLPEDQVNITEIEKYRHLPAWEDLKATLVLGYDGEAIKYYEVIQAILNAFWGVLVPGGDGRITTRFAGLDPHVLATPLYTIGPDRIVAFDGFNRMTDAPQVFYSHQNRATGVQVAVDRFANGQPTLVNLCDPDAAAFYDTRLISLDCGYLTFSSSLSNFLQSRFEAVIERLGQPAPKISFEGRTREQALLAGDQIKLDLSGIPGTANPKSGSKNYSEPVWAEICAREFDPESGRAQIEADIIGLNDTLRKGVIAPSAYIESYNDGTLQLTVAENVFVSSSNPYGGKDSSHFQDGDQVRVWDPSAASWKGFAVINGDPTSTTISLRDVNFSTNPAAGDILEYNQWPATKDVNDQDKCVHLADDGANANQVDEDEFLPVSFGPADYSDEPFVMSADGN